MPPFLGIARGTWHVVHHSSERYNLSTALRRSWTGTFTGWIFWMWLPWLGFPPMMVLTMQAISLLYQFWIHTELVSSLGPLELVFNTVPEIWHFMPPRFPNSGWKRFACWVAPCNVR